MKFVTIALALLMLATAAHADGKPISKKPYSNWVWEELGCGLKCPEQAGVEKAHREFDQADRDSRAVATYEMALRELQADAIRRRQLAGKSGK
jgi:hypothetical protein